MTALLNHLWQSSVFAALLWLLTLALRSNRARRRHDLWLAASIKFLIPFSAFLTIGSQFHWRPSHPVQHANFAVAIDTASQVSEPFTYVPPGAAPARREVPWPAILLSIWAAGFIGISAAWLIRWNRIRIAIRAARPVDIDAPIRSVESPTLIEPGVFGVFRPVLMLPEGILDRLTAEQLQSVIDHEMCHVRSQDNLIAVFQMFVETAFWFHPLVWWIGNRMIAERERACDEAVLESGSRPQVYAEAILNVCKLYVESPMPCVAGVTGAGLKQRIEAIVSNRIGAELSRAKKALLAMCAAATVLTPVAIGIMNAPSMRAQSPDAPKNVPKWEAVSIRPCDSNGDPGRSGGNAKGGGSVGRGPGRMNINCQTPMQMMNQAYGPFSDGRRMSFRRATFEGAPAWTSTERFAIEGKAETPEGRIMMQGPMMQQLLADRFKLKIRRETREIPVYNLVLVKPGSKYITPAKPGGCTPLNMEPGAPFPDEKTKLCEIIGRGVLPGELQGQFQGYGFTMDRFAEQLGALVDRPVIDKTGLSGTFDIEVPLPLEDLTLEKDPHGDGERYRDEDMIFSAIRHLGMKLESAKGPGIVYVIESIERPTDNFTPPQAEAKPAPRFEVASIKPCQPGQMISGSGVTSPGRLSTGCAPLALEDHTGLIQRAYVRYEGGRYHPFGPTGLLAIEGAPAWTHSEFFAIEAKAATPETPEMMQGPMMQKLLEERFKLKVHRETREGPVYNLTLLKSKLRPFKDGSCTNARVPGMPPVELKQGEHFCKLLVGLGATGAIDAEGATVSEFVALLNLALDRQVVDKTGLAGRFDIHIDFTRLENDATDANADRPSIFSAVQQQLGLKLERARGPNEFLVIDHVEKPTEN